MSTGVSDRRKFLLDWGWKIGMALLGLVLFYGEFVRKATIKEESATVLATKVDELSRKIDTTLIMMTATFTSKEEERTFRDGITDRLDDLRANIAAMRAGK